MFDERAINNLS